jgi:hypothetical protein
MAPPDLHLEPGEALAAQNPLEWALSSWQRTPASVVPFQGGGQFFQLPAAFIETLEPEDAQRRGVGCQKTASRIEQHQPFSHAAEDGFQLGGDDLPGLVFEHALARRSFGH